MKKSRCSSKYKVCKICDLRKPIKSFDKQTVKGKTYYKPYCHTCKSNRYRKQNPIKSNERAKAYKIKYRSKQLLMKYQLMVEIGQTECKDCGYKDVRALSFHHREGKEKTFIISYGFTHNYSFDTLLTEAKKCDILCMNCHALHHCTLPPLSDII